MEQESSEANGSTRHPEAPLEHAAGDSGSSTGPAINRPPRRLFALAAALPVLFIGLLCLVLPVLDMLPLPGSSQSAFFETWILGVPLTWGGLRLLRRGLGRPT